MISARLVVIGGSHGASEVQARGGVVLVQSPSTAENPTMPQAAIQATRTRHVLPPEEMPAFLLGLREGSKP